MYIYTYMNMNLNDLYINYVSKNIKYMIIMTEINVMIRTSTRTRAWKWMDMDTIPTPGIDM
jgi:hypothetical protein